MYTVQQPVLHLYISVLLYKRLCSPVMCLFYLHVQQTELPGCVCSTTASAASGLILFYSIFADPGKGYSTAAFATLDLSVIKHSVFHLRMSV